MNKLFVIRKFIYANSASEAIKKDKTSKVDECWVDEGWKNENMSKGNSVKGFENGKGK